MLGVNGLLCLVHIFLIFQQSMHILGPLTSRGRSWKEMINLGFRAKRKINTTQVGSSALFFLRVSPTRFGTARGGIYANIAMDTKKESTQNFYF